MDRGIFLLGMAKAVGEDGDIFEIEFRSGGLRWRSELPPERKKIANRFLKVHLNSSVCLRSALLKDFLAFASFRNLQTTG